MTPRNSARFGLAGRALALASGTILSAAIALSPAAAQAPAETPVPAAPAAPAPAPAAEAPAAPAAPAPVAPEPAAPVPPGEAAAAPAAPEGDENTIIGYVNGEPITRGDVSVASFVLSAEIESVPLGERMNAATNMLVTLKLLADQATATGLDQSADYANRMEFYHRQALRDVFVNEKVIGRITEDLIQACYDKLAAEVSNQEEVRASHILVATEPEAIDIIAQLRAGADFAELATRLSTDATTKENGGELGFMQRGQTVDPFDAALFALEPGAITEQPVQTQFGWHVIKAEERRMTPPPAFDEVRDNLEQHLWSEYYRAWVDALTNSATFVSTADAPTPPTPTPVVIDDIDPRTVVDCLMVADATPIAPPAPAVPEAPAAPAAPAPVAPAPAPAAPTP